MPEPIHVIADDGIGLAALINVAGQIWDLTDDRNVILGVGYIEGEAVAVVIAKRDVGEPNALAVTIEANPRVIRLG